MSDLDDLEGISDSVKATHSFKNRLSPKERARRSANGSAMNQRPRQKKSLLKSMARCSGTRRRKCVPITLAPIGGSK